MPEKADLVMYWWDQAAGLAKAGHLRRFGLITTNSITQVFQRRVLAQHIHDEKTHVQIIFAIPDHPWVDEAGSAAVRVAMTVGCSGDNAPSALPRLGRVIVEGDNEEQVTVALDAVEMIGETLQASAGAESTTPLSANDGVCSPGIQLYGAGFILAEETVNQWQSEPGWEQLSTIVHPYMNGRDLMGNSRGAFVIDFYGLEREESARRHPRAFQHILDYVKPERDQNRRDAIREKWWRFGWERPVWRAAVGNLSRFISTPETSKHRVFVFLPAEVRPDNMLSNFALDDALNLGILSSRSHTAWAFASGARLEDRPRYTKQLCFDPFPFPACTDFQKSRIRSLGESLDAHRKRQQSLHPGLTITDMYNVLEKLRKMSGNSSVPPVPPPAALASSTAPTTAVELSRRFKNAKADRIGELLATLTALGQARSVGAERFVA